MLNLTFKLTFIYFYFISKTCINIFIIIIIIIYFIYYNVKDYNRWL